LASRITGERVREQIASFVPPGDSRTNACDFVVDSPPRSSIFSGFANGGDAEISQIAARSPWRPNASTRASTFVTRSSVPSVTFTGAETARCDRRPSPRCR
jgi:hypothetical protein